MILGDHHQHVNESLSVEFKTFCLNIDSESLYDIFDVEKMCKDGIIHDHSQFNNIILKSIKYYFYKYIPRYTSAFLNSNIKNAELYFGVDDFGEITGIPFFGTRHQLEEYISNIDVNIYLQCKKERKVPLKIEIQQLTINNDYLQDESDNILKEFKDNLNRKHYLSVKYKINRLKWGESLNEYTCKLPMLIESKRIEFDKYLKIHAPHLLGYSILPHEMKNIAHLKKDPTHYIYWLMQFKEINITKLKTQKPTKPIHPKIIHGPDYLITQLTHMRSKFTKANPKLNYFIIKITFPKETKPYTPVYYFNIDNESWIQKIRKLNVNVGPCCL